MSSLEQRLSRIEEKLKQENKEARRRIDLSIDMSPQRSRPRPIIVIQLSPAPAPSQRAALQLPLANDGGSRSSSSENSPQHHPPSGRPRQMLTLPTPPYGLQKSLENAEIDQKLQEIMKQTGYLKMDGQRYPAEVSDLLNEGEIGSGTCGQVFKVRFKKTGHVIAVKQMRRTGNKDENKRILMDLDVVLKSHDCPYIIQCYGAIVTNTDVFIAMELMGTCAEKLKKRIQAPIPERILGKMTVAIVKALLYLKEKHGVIHRDVKPSNILIDAKGQIKLCDFGISGRLVDSKAKTRSAGCAAYMAVELATGQFPYKNCKTDFEVLTKVLQEDPPLLPTSMGFSLDFQSFVKDCLTKDHRKRPKYLKLLEHNFIRRYEVLEVDVAGWFQDIMEKTESPRTSQCYNQHQLLSLFSRRSALAVAACPVTGTGGSASTRSDPRAILVLRERKQRGGDRPTRGEEDQTDRLKGHSYQASPFTVVAFWTERVVCERTGIEQQVLMEVELREDRPGLVCLLRTVAGLTSARQCQPTPMGELSPVQGLLETYQAGVGCATQGSLGPEVHVINLRRISAPDDSQISRGSTVQNLLQNLTFVQISEKNLPNKNERLLRWVLSKYHTVTSFNEFDQVNHIYIRAGYDPMMPSTCTLKKFFLSQNYMASNLQAQEVHSCLTTGYRCDPEVHLIYLRSAGSSLCQKEGQCPVIDLEKAMWMKAEKTQKKEGCLEKTKSKGLKISLQVDVLVTLQPPAKEKHTWADVVLILKSDASVNWIIKAHGMRGRLRVQASNSISTGLDLDPQLDFSYDTSRELQEASDMAEWAAQRGFPSITSYTEADLANRFVITVPAPGCAAIQPRSHKPAPFYGGHSARLPPGAGFESLFQHWLLQGEANSSEHETLLQVLEESISVSCHGDTISVTANRSVLEVVGLASAELTLKNRSCRAVLNGSHFIWDFNITSCGTEADLSSGSLGVLYRNAVLVWTPDALDGLANETLEGFDKDELLEASPKIVEASMLWGEPGLGLRMQSCYVSPISNPEGTPRWPVISGTCPLDESVTFYDEEHQEERWERQDRVRFSFILRPRFNNSVQFLHCRMSMCGVGVDGTVFRHGAHLPLCVSLDDVCTGHTAPPSGDALSGPFGRILSKPIVVTVEGGTTQSYDLLAGLETPVVVGIASAAFVIGVCLTGALWCISSRTEAGVGEVGGSVGGVAKIKRAGFELKALTCGRGPLFALSFSSVILKEAAALYSSPDSPAVSLRSCCGRPRRLKERRLGSCAKEMKTRLSFLLQRPDSSSGDQNMQSENSLEVAERSGRPTPHEAQEWGRSLEALLSYHNGIQAFRSFLRSEFSEENIEFWLACQDYRATKSAAKVVPKARKIYSEYISIQAPKEINLDSQTREAITHSLAHPTMCCFNAAQRRVYSLMEKDSYPRFLKSQMYQDLIALGQR
ncbi:MP2K7 kinase, partial [Polypterus senegalus]